MILIIIAIIITTIEYLLLDTFIMIPVRPLYMAYLKQIQQPEDSIPLILY
jgi:hypothetical protein